MANHFTAASRLLLLPAILSLASCQRVDPQAPETSPLPEIITTAGGIEMVRIPAGRFTMGDDRDEDDQSPTHDVQIDAFLLDRYEVTQQHYVPMMLDSGSNFKGPNRPVEMVSWIKAASYCNARSEEEGLEPCYREDLTCDFEADGYRLPTEAEWEYACRAGGKTLYSFGSDPGKLADHAWYKTNGRKQTHPVGQKKPNTWGLYDMHGNVAEWCNDVYDKDYYAASPAENPSGPASGQKYVLRGGSFAGTAESCRSARRAADTPGYTDACFPRETIGFRCVRRAKEMTKHE